MRRYAFRWVCLEAGLLLLGIPLAGQAGTEKTSTADRSNVPSHGQPTSDTHRTGVRGTC